MQSFSHPEEKVKKSSPEQSPQTFFARKDKNFSKKFAESKNMRTFASAFRESNCLGAVVQLG